MFWMRWLVFLSFAIPAAIAIEDVEGLTIEVVKTPTACAWKSMDKDYVEIHYTTKIDKSSATGKPGKQIDTSRDADGLNDPLSFQLGTGRVIEGWDLGVRDMCQGEKRVLTIQPELAYGTHGYEDTDSEKTKISIPANATLSMDVELIKIIRLQKDTTFKPENCERVSQPGDTLKVHYTLWIHPTSTSGDKGSMIETSREKGSEPLSFVLGAGRVIPGWDQGLEGLCVGEKIEMIVPPEFGYQEKGSSTGKVPPLATLWYEVELVEAEETNMFQQMDTNKDGKIDKEELGVFMKRTQNLGDEKVVQQILDGEDKNKDGFIDWDEAPFPKGDRPKINVLTGKTEL